MPEQYTIDKDFHNTRLDRWFKNKIINLPQSLIEKIIRQNKIKINKKKTKSSYRVQNGDKIDTWKDLSGNGNHVYQSDESKKTCDSIKF